MLPSDVMCSSTLVLARLVARGGKATAAEIFGDLQSAGLTLADQQIHRVCTSLAQKALIILDYVPLGAAPAKRGRRYAITAAGRNALAARQVVLELVQRPTNPAAFVPLNQLGGGVHPLPSSFPRW